MKRNNKDNSEDNLLKTAKQCWREDFWLKILTFSSVGLIITSFFMPPAGYIDPTVMAGVGELTGIGAIWEFDKAMNKNISAKVKIHEIELELTRTKKGLPTPELDDKNIGEDED